MRVACAIACLLAAPEVAAFHVAIPTGLPRGGGFSSAGVARKSAPAAKALRSATGARMLSVGGQEENAQARRFATMVSATEYAVQSSGGVVGKIESLRGGGGEVAQANSKSKMFQAYETAARWFTNLFPIWLCVFSGVALKDPSVFAWFTTE